MNKKYKKPTIEKLEIYKQRYETFRHLDKLRWQMLQIAIATGSVVLVFGKDDSTKPGWWAWFVVGIILLILGFAMGRIGHGIKKNGEVLRSAGNAIGDIDIPKESSNLKSSSFWIMTIMIVAGLVCLALPFLLLTCST